MARRIVLEFVDEGVSAVAELLEQQAPKTCAAVLDLLPQLREANHAVYSGSEVAFLLDRYIVVPRENSTTKVIPGDVGYTQFEGGVFYGIDEGFSELCWFYDRDAVPSMPDGPVPVNIFARIVEGADAFYAVCRRMRREGNKRVAVRLTE